MRAGSKLISLVGLLVVLQANQTFSQSKKESKAKSKIEEHDVSSPTNSPEARDLYNKGVEKFEQGDFKKAIHYYGEAIKIDKNYTDAYDNLGLTFRQLGKLDSAEYYYKKSIDIFPDGTVARTNLGQVYTI